VNDLVALEGFWVLSDGSGSLVLDGEPPEDCTVTLVPGWNLVGTCVAVDLPSPAVEPRLGSAWSWDASDGRGRYVKAWRLLPGKAYWVYWAGDAPFEF
jgi:hypothetical protein